jgi:hypothetical protein
MGEKILSKLLVITTTCALFLMAGSARGQQVDAAFGVSTITAPSGSSASADFQPQTLGGGAYPTFSANYLIKHHLGVNGEVSWRAHQNTYLGFQPFRPILFDFNGIWAPEIAHRVGAELMGGIGVADVRFYQPFFTCSAFSGCTNFTTTKHFMGHFGAGIKLYVTENFFIRPEAHLYLIHNNFEFSGPRAERLGISIGYTWRSSY